MITAEDIRAAMDAVDDVDEISDDQAMRIAQILTAPGRLDG